MANQANDKNQRRDAARQKALEIQKEQERRERRSRMIILLSVIAGLAVVIGLAVMILSKAPKDIDPDITAIPAEVSAPAAATDTGAFNMYKGEIVETAPEGVPVLDLYLDFMCSHCAAFEGLHSDYVMAKQDAGEAVVSFHPISILGYTAAIERGSTYAALFDIDPIVAQQYSKWAFENQQNTNLTETVQAEYLETLGISAADAEKATNGDYDRFIQAASTVTLNNESLRDETGGFGTPAIYFNGEKVLTSYTDVEGFQADIDSRIAAN